MKKKHLSVDDWALLSVGACARTWLFLSSASSCTFGAKTRGGGGVYIFFCLGTKCTWMHTCAPIYTQWGGWGCCDHVTVLRGRIIQGQLRKAVPERGMQGRRDGGMESDS